MIPAQRRALILDRLKKDGAAAIMDLSTSLGISASTVRRDFDYLMQEGYLERTHGGAMVRLSTRPTFEPHADINSRTAQPAKMAIGLHAAEMVSEHQSVIFDSSSTVLEAAREIVRQRLPITAITNDLAIAAELATGPGIRLVVIGGSHRPQSMTLVGDPGATFVAGLHVDIAFIGGHAITANALSETSIDVAGIKRQMAAAAAKRVLLADSSKFGGPSFCQVCPLKDIDVLITDAGISEQALAGVRSQGVDVRVVKVEDKSASGSFRANIV